MATPPARVNVGSQNQSQPYFIASHANFNRPGGDAAAASIAAGAQGHELGPPVGYRERQASPMLEHPDWSRSRDKIQSRDTYPRDDRREQQAKSLLMSATLNIPPSSPRPCVRGSRSGSISTRITEVPIRLAYLIRKTYIPLFWSLRLLRLVLHLGSPVGAETRRVNSRQRRRD